MNDRVSEKTPTKGNFTPALVNQVKIENTDITGLPYEVPHITRPTILEIFKDTLSEGLVFGFTTLDIDGLKPLNDRFTHAGADVLIVNFVRVLEERLARLQEEGVLLGYGIYRPHAGGDEVNAIFTLGKERSKEDLARSISEVIEMPVVSSEEELAEKMKEATGGKVSGGEVTMTCSCGTKIVDGSDWPEDTEGKKIKIGTWFNRMTLESDDTAGKKKMNKIMKEVGAMVVDGRPLGSEEFLEMICERWGSKRTGYEAMKILFEVYNAKRIKESAKGWQGLAGAR